MTVVEVRYSDIPVWLRDSQFFDSLSSDEPECLIIIPTECFPPAGDLVQSVEDLVHTIRVIDFWGTRIIPTNVLDYCYAQDLVMWGDAISVIDIPEVKLLQRVFKSVGDVTLEAALQTNRSEILSFWLNNHDRGSKNSEKAIVHACRFGRLDLVQTLREHRYPVSSYAYRAAAQYGHVHVLKYLLKNHFPWDYRAIHYAFRGGHVECVKCLHNHSNAWDKSITLEFAVSQHYATLPISVHDFWTDDWSILPPDNGYITCLRYALENNCDIAPSTWDKACSYGLLDCLQLLHQYEILYEGGSPANAAAFAGQLHCLQYMHSIGCPWNILAPDYAAQCGHLDCLKYILENGGSFQEKHLLQSAASSGQGSECLKYLVEERNFSLKEDVIVGYIHPSQRKKIVKRDDSIFGVAFMRADLSSVQYLIINGCPYKQFTFQAPKNDLVQASRDADFVQCIQYAIEHGWQYSKELEEYIIWWNGLPDHTRHLPLCMAYVEERKTLKTAA